jgi:hypothetical protein
VRDRPQLAHVRYDHFVAEFLELLANPDRVHPCFIAIRASGRSVNHFSMAFGVVLKRPRPTTSPSRLSVQ